MRKYSIISRRKGVRRAYGDGFVYPDLDYAERYARNQYLTGQYSMVKVVETDTNRTVYLFNKANQP